MADSEAARAASAQAKLDKVFYNVDKSGEVSTDRPKSGGEVSTHDAHLSRDKAAAIARLRAKRIGS